MATATFQPDGTAGKDTYLNDQAPTTNFDAAAAGLVFGYTTVKPATKLRAVLEFDLSTDIGGGSVPAGATINSVSLAFQHTQDAAGVGVNTAGAYTIALIASGSSASWVENQATWNVYSTGNNWGTAGGDLDGTYTTTATLTNGGSAAPVTMTFATSAGFVSLVQEAVTNRSRILKLIIKGTDETSDTQVQVDSSDDATGSDRPLLTIDYTAAAAADQQVTAPTFFAAGGIGVV